MLGIGAGLAIAVLTRIVETSRLAFGPFAFYGNGALIVPALGAALALYGLWVWVIRRGRPRLELLWSVLGLHLGVGSVALMSDPPSIPGLVFTGLLFVIPTAIAAFGVLWALERRLTPASPAGARAHALLLTVVVLVGLLLAVSPLATVGTGLIAGAFIPVGARASSAGAVGLGALLLVVLLAAGLAVPLLVYR